MSSLRGFGFTLDTQTGHARNWYVAGDGIRRWADTNRPVEPEVSPQAAMVERALRRAYDLGQSYAAQADSESTSQWKKADETRAAFFSLIGETVAAIDAAMPTTPEASK